MILAPRPLVERRVARGAETTFNQLVPRARGYRSYPHRPPIFLPFSNFGHRKTLSFQSDETPLETDKKSRRPTSKKWRFSLADDRGRLCGSRAAHTPPFSARFSRSHRDARTSARLVTHYCVLRARCAAVLQPSAFPASLQPDWALDTVLGHNLRRKSATHQLSSQLPSCSRCTRALLLHACLFLLLCSAGAQLVAHAHS